jgi:transketolase
LATLPAKPRLTDPDTAHATDDAWVGDARRLALGIRRRALDVTIAKNGSYLCQACSGAEILATLHRRVMDRSAGDVLVLSPAHYALALYATLVELGELDPELLDSYQDDGALLEMIPSGSAPGMLFTTGSLAQALSQSIGLALARQLRGDPGGVFVYVSDGELQEGQTWEALMAVAHYGLTELVVVLDLNDSQVDGSPDDVMALEPIAGKLAAFGLDVVEVDGHDPVAIAAAIERPGRGAPRAVACRTRMWEGIPSLADRPNLHFVRFREGEAERAIADLDLAEASLA